MTEHNDINTGLAQIHAETRWLRRKNAQAFSGSVIAAAFASALVITINTRSLIWGIAAFGFATVIASVVFAFRPRAGGGSVLHRLGTPLFAAVMLSAALLIYYVTTNGMLNDLLV